MGITLTATLNTGSATGSGAAKGAAGGSSTGSAGGDGDAGGLSPFAALLQGQLHGSHNILADKDGSTDKDLKADAKDGKDKAKDATEVDAANVTETSLPLDPAMLAAAAVLENAALKKDSQASGKDVDASKPGTLAPASGGVGKKPADATTSPEFKTADAKPGVDITDAPQQGSAKSLSAPAESNVFQQALSAAENKSSSLPGLESFAQQGKDGETAVQPDFSVQANSALNAAAANLAAQAPAAKVPQNVPLVVIQPPVASQEWTPAIGNGIKLLVQNKSSVAELQVTPPDLGPINVRIDFSDKPVVAITVQHSDTKDALDAALPRLREMLAGNGIALSGSGVEYRQAGSDSTRQNTGDDRPWQGNRDRDKAPDAIAAAAPVRSVRVSQLGAVDTYA
ncbi:MAG TPA: flagellar hook-length control protein FliK [Burkholderiales bacterium]|nr:flagellar hook-length control protein FliK [Burkholderiales bacterium]